jgi:hypothetical protein
MCLPLLVHAIPPHWTVFIVLYMLAREHFQRGMSRLMGSDLNASASMSTQRNQTQLQLRVTLDRIG